MPPHLTGIRQDNVENYDPIWARVRSEAEEAVAQTPALGGFIFANLLNHSRLEDAIGHRLAQRLDHADVSADLIRQAFGKVLEQHGDLAGIFRADLAAVVDRDPACKRLIEPLLYFKGFHALQTQRFAHRMWRNGDRDFALYLQSQSSRVFGVDIHPAARIGSGIMFDHATGIVIGETAEVGDMSSLLHGVTLGGSGKEGGDRHPKVGRHVMIGAGAKILGNINVGHCARVAAGSVVLKDVPPNTTVAGVPAKVVGKAGCPDPARSMNQMLGLDDGAPLRETDG
jgi:serine O-acetyltransferase